MSARTSLRLSIGLSLLLLFIAPWWGITGISATEIFGGDRSQTLIFWQLRVPQSLLAFLVGASLGLSGAVFQALFRNPLATPYTLGVASGASFASVVFLYFGLESVFYFFPASRFAGFLGSLLALGSLFFFARFSVRRSLSSLLLIGVALGFFFSSMILLLQYLSSPTQGYVALRWLMGGVETLGYRVVAELLLVFGLCFWGIYRHHQELDLLCIDEDFALSRGVQVRSLQCYLIALASVLVGVTVSAAGPIGFVGLLIPHACRLLLGPKHQLLLPVIACASGSFLLVCDCISRVLFAPVVLPVGVVTAVLGAPLFLLLLLRSERELF